MAGHARYTALLDACVLYPLAMADALMSLATAGLFAAKWTTRIETEWIAALETRRPDLKGRLNVRRDQMREAIPDWEVPEDAWHACTGNLALPDPDDVHVLAAALCGHADCIVTANLKSACVPGGRSPKPVRKTLQRPWSAGDCLPRPSGSEKPPNSSEHQARAVHTVSGIPDCSDRVIASPMRVASIASDSVSDSGSTPRQAATNAAISCVNADSNRS